LFYLGGGTIDNSSYTILDCVIKYLSESNMILTQPGHLFNGGNPFRVFFRIHKPTVFDTL